MIDIHVHLLPGQGDGPADRDEAIRMVQVAAADGIRAMVATPHDDGWERDQGQARRCVEAAVAELQSAVEQRGIEVKLYPGVEAAMDLRLPAAVRQGSVFPLAGSRYLLVELPFEGTVTYAEHVLFELQLQRWVPIVAHPERQGGVLADPNLLYRWVERGALAQLNGGSLLGQFGSRVEQTARALLEHGLIHFLASDGHDPVYRPPVLSSARARAAALVGGEEASQLVVGRPAAVLADQAIQVPPPRLVRRRRWFGRR